MKGGWQYYLSECLPKTNNNIEAYNKTLKDFVTKRKAEDFSTYFDLMKKEVRRKSRQENNLPIAPTIPRQFYLLAEYVSNKFEDLFLELDSCYYIRDKTVNFSFLDQKKKGVFTWLKKNIHKIGNNEDIKKEFYAHFRRPTLDEARSYELPGMMDKAAFLKCCKIRKITKANQINNEFPVLSFRCTCPDYKEVSYCIHTLSVLTKLKLLSKSSFIKKAKRGRPANVSGAYERDVDSDDGADHE